MAMTVIAKPERIAPAYNPLKYEYDSTNKNNEGFRYVFDIYNASAVKIAEYRVLPKPTTGYGEIDLSRLLQSYVSYDFDPTDANFTASNSVFEYDIDIGEEYVTVVNWTSNLVNNGGSVQIVATHAFQIGDQVVVEGGNDNPNITGLWTVTDISTTVNFTINASWSLVDDATGNGSVRYSDNRKTVTRSIETVNAFVFNGAVPFKDYSAYVVDDYLLDDANAKFLTSMPQSTIYITPEQDFCVNLLTKNNNSGRLVFKNDSGDSAYRLVPEVPIAMHKIAGDNLGLTATAGTLPIVKANTQYYDVYFFEGSIKSRTYRLYIDTRCKINDYEICFLDRMGSIGSFAFQLRDQLTGVVTKETYNQDIQGGVTSQKWGYDSYEQGLRVINPSIEEEYVLNTNWMNEDMASYFTELVSSPQTWMKIDNKYYACIVTETAYEKERQRNRNLIRKTIRVKLSVQDRVNG